MTKDTEELINGLMQDKSPVVTGSAALQDLSLKFPYCSFIHYALTAKKYEENSKDAPSCLNRLSLYTKNPNWLALRLEEEKAKPTTLPIIPIEPYHTVDYFASQGIKLGKMEENDTLGKRVKSFTSWLKTMKKIQQNSQSDETTDGQPEHMNGGPSSSSIAVTEAMADVYLMQGQRQKAIEILDKLSLQNPANSHIFARKISDIKENRI